MNSEMSLSKQNKQYLLSLGYTEETFDSIEKVMNNAVFIISEVEDPSSLEIISNIDAEEFLGNEIFLDTVAKSIFNSTTVRTIPHTFEEYNIIINNGKENTFFKEGGYIDIPQVEMLTHNIVFRASDIKWDTSNGFCKEELESEKDRQIDLPSTIYIPMEALPSLADLDGVSDYLSDETGFCHDGFVLECNMTIEEMYAELEHSNKELEEEYKDGETNWAANLECIIEEIEAAICIMEEIKEENEIGMDKE